MNTCTSIFQGFYFYSVNSCIFFLTFTEQVFFRTPLNGGCCYCYICRAYSNSSVGTIIARSHLPFFKIFSNFTFLPKLSNIFPFFPFFRKIACMSLLSRIGPDLSHFISTFRKQLLVTCRV